MIANQAARMRIPNLPSPTSMYQKIITTVFIVCAAIVAQADEVKHIDEVASIVPGSCNFVYPAAAIENHEEGNRSRTHCI